MRVGPYEVESELGRGGMGVVYAVRRDGRSLALKWIEREQAEPDLLERFRLEAQALARVAHPHVVSLIDFGTTPRGLYLVMERVEGESLERRLRGGPLPTDEAAEVMLQLCAGVAAAHEVGVLHRDLKPANVLLCPGRGAVLTDFGLARRLDAKDRLTRTGEVLGTPHYMAPEQAYGSKQTDVRTDVYGLGATLYSLLCARTPFGGASVLQILDSVAHEAPRAPSEVGPVDPGLEAICLRCLAKSPQERYASVDELTHALRAWRTPATRRPPLPWALLGVGALLAVLGTTYAWLSARSEAELEAPRVEASSAPAPGPSSPAPSASSTATSAPTPSKPAPQRQAFASWDGGLLRGVLALSGLNPAEREALERALAFALADSVADLEPARLPAAETWVGRVARLALGVVRHRRRIAQGRSEPEAASELLRFGSEAGTCYERAPTPREAAVAALTYGSTQVLLADDSPLGLQRDASAALVLQHELPSLPAAALPAACAVTDLALRPLMQRQPDPTQRKLLQERLGEVAAQWLELEPGHAVATFRVAETHHQLGKSERALQIALDHPKSPKLTLLGLRVLHEAGRLRELARRTREILAAPPRWSAATLSEVVLWRARAARGLGNTGAAKRLLDKYGRLANQDPRLSHEFKLELARLPVPPGVGESLLEIGRRAAADPSVDLRRRGLELQATVYAQRGDSLRARVALRHALQLEPLPEHAERMRRALVDLSAPELPASERVEVVAAMAELAAHLPVLALTRLSQAGRKRGEFTRSRFVCRLLIHAVAESSSPVWRVWSGYEAKAPERIFELGLRLSDSFVGQKEEDPEALGDYLLARARLRFVSCFAHTDREDLALEEAQLGLQELRRAEELLAAPVPARLEEARARLEFVLGGLAEPGTTRTELLRAARRSISRQEQLLPAESPYGSLSSAWFFLQVGDDSRASEELERASRSAIPLSTLEQMISLAGARHHYRRKRWRAVLTHTTRGLQATEIPARLRFRLAFLHGAAALELGDASAALKQLESALRAGQSFSPPTSQRRGLLEAKARAHAALGDEAAAQRARAAAAALTDPARPGRR